MKVVSDDALKRLGGHAPEHLAGTSSASCIRTPGPLIDVERWIGDHALDVNGPRPWNGGKRWIFPVCPWNSEHRNNSAYIVQLANGAIAAGCLHNGCVGNDWHSLRDLVEPGWHQRTAIVDRQPDAVDEVWEPPVAFGHFSPPRFPTETLPHWLREFVESEAIATQTPTDLAAWLALCLVATAVAKKVMISIKQGYREPLNIFSVTVLPPGNRKSAVFTDVMKPIAEYEKSECHRADFEISKATAVYKITEGRLKKAQDEAVKAKPQERERLVEEAASLAADLASTRVPKSPCFFVDDCTPEQLATILRDQGGRLAVLSPEGDVFDMMAGRYSSDRSSNLGVYLKGHAGDQLRVDRVGRPPDYVEQPALTVGLAVQPEVLRGLADKPGFRGRGLLGRFIYSLPQSLLGRRNVDAAPMPDSIRASYHSHIRKLLELPGTVDQGKHADPQLLHLAPDAQASLRQFEALVEPQLAEFGELGGISDWAGKLVGAVARIAGLLHMATFADLDCPWQTPVSKDLVEGAILIGFSYMIPHAKAAFTEMGADTAVESARCILRWIDHTGATAFTKRDVHQGVKGSFKRVEELDIPLSVLEAHGYVRKMTVPKREGPGRKPSPAYEVNPLWIRDAAGVSRAREHFENSENCENPTPGAGPGEAAGEIRHRLRAKSAAND
jgi:hypothetical protein